MKKLLFCASILAIAASCTEDQLDSNSVKAPQYKGISFEATLADAPETKGDLSYNEVNGTHDFFWYAETDKINIWSIQTTGTNGGVTGTNWDKTKKASYKATQSASRGVFTGSSDDDILDFEYEPSDFKTDDDIKAKSSQFFAVYPSEATVEDITDGKFRIGTLPSLANQDQTAKNGNAVTNKLLMYSFTSAYPEHSYDAVGEKINLNFVRPFTALIFGTKGINKEYQDYFGNLQTISIEMKGYGEGKDAIDPSYIDYGTDAQYVFDSNDPSKSKLVDKDAPDADELDWENMTAAASSITLNINGGTSGTGLEWSDGDNAYMAINSVDRSEFAKKGVKESMDISFNFKWIELNYSLESDANWPGVVGNNNFVRVPALDINSFPYLVTKDRGINDRVLIVNSGKFSDIFKEGTNNGQVEWNDDDPALSEFSTIIANVALDKDELALLQNFTNLKAITLAENTEIPTGTFTQTSLKDIDFPKVTVIEDKAFADEIALENVVLPAYGFENEVIAMQILEPTSLKTLDMSGVSAMAVGFPSTGFTLSGYTALTDVKVKDGVKLGATAFSGCTSLENVEGTVSVEGGAEFKGCTSLAKINIMNTAIPASTFEGCTKLKDVLYNGKQVAPTSVETKAFSGTAIVEMDLRNLTKVGQAAFKDCKSLYGEVVDGVKHVLYVGGEEIGQEAFAGCNAIEHIQFLDATKFGNNVLKVTSTTLKQIQFDQVIDVNYVSYDDTTFGSNTDNVTLFINPDQDINNYDDSHLLLRGVTGGIEFKAVQFKSGSL